MDIDGDGDKDILSGSYSRMDQPMAGLFQVLRGKADGGFDEAKALLGTDMKPLVIPYEGDREMTQGICTRPTAVDWDGDGDLDLVVGNFAGSFYLFQGEGQGRFKPEAIAMKHADGKTLKIPSAHSDPFPVDWDGDGDLDMVSGSSSGPIYIAHNSAGKGKEPKLGAFEVLLDDSPPIGEGALASSHRHATRVWVDDVNGDDKLDLIVGDAVTLEFPAEGLTAEETEKRKKAWMEKMGELQKKLQDARGEEGGAAGELQTQLNELWASKSEFLKDEMTGFVWMYLQK